MKVFSRLIPLVAGLICLATTYTPSASSTSEFDVGGFLAEIFPEHELDSSFTEADQNGYAFDVKYNDAVATPNRAVHPSIQKRDGFKQFIAVPKENNAGWRIEVQGDESLAYETLDATESFWVGEITKAKGHSKFGSGAEGTVWRGTWQPYKVPVKAKLTEKIQRKYFATPSPAAIKQSSGYDDYYAARLVRLVESRAIVESYMYSYRELVSPTKSPETESIVAYEVLNENADPIWGRDRSTRLAVLAAVIDAAIDAEKYGLYNMDFKFENVMKACDWVTIDWTMFVLGDNSTVSLDVLGTPGFMAPKIAMSRLGPRVEWNVDKSSLWVIGMMSLYVHLGSYRYTPDTNMRKYAKLWGLEGNEDTHPYWWWVALMVADSEDHEIPISIFGHDLRSTLKPQTLNFWNKTLCKEERRITIGELKDFGRKADD